MVGLRPPPRACGEASAVDGGDSAAIGAGCREGIAKDVAIRCAIASAALGDLDGAVAMLGARARVAPSEGSELARIATELRAEAERRSAPRRAVAASR